MMTVSCRCASSSEGKEVVVVVGPGKPAVFEAPPPLWLDVVQLQPHLAYSAFLPTLYPVVIRLTCPASATVFSSSSATSQQQQLTYAEVVRSSSSPPLYQLKVLKQKLVLEGRVFELAEIYGLGPESTTTNSNNTSTSSIVTSDLSSPEGASCVICLTQPRTTAALPCRHLCLCHECAEQLRRKSSKCPVCRAAIDRLLTIQQQQQHVSASPATTPVTTTTTTTTSLPQDHPP